MFSSKMIRAILMLMMLLSTSIHGAEKTTGTLVVSYGTGIDAIRLNRVRFLLISDNGSYRLFPQENGFVDDPVTKKRMVLIENLPQGNYTVKFVYPNSDNLFEKIEPRTVSLKGGGVVKVDQDIRIQNVNDQDKLEESGALELAYEPLPFSQEAPPLREVRLYSYPQGVPQALGYLNIRTNIPIAKWILSKDGVKIASGEGSVKDLALPQGSGYKLAVQEIDNYEVKILPQNNIIISSSQTQTVEILYKRILGTVQVITSMPSAHQLTITIEGINLKEPIQTTQIARGNKIDWKSTGLPLGTYILTLKPPVYYEDISPFKIVLKQGQNAIVKPIMKGGNKILVTTNSSEALFVLKQDIGPLVMEGKGDTYTFEGLFPGTYTLTYSTNDPSRFIPPRSQRITLSKFKQENEPVYAEYTFAGTLKVTGNIPRFNAKIESKTGNIQSFKEEITNYTKTITLPEGQWRLTFTPYNGTPLPQQNITLDAFETEEISLKFPVEGETPQPEKTALKETEKIKGIDELYQDLLFVPIGLSILGDPYGLDPENTIPARVVELSSFEISKYEVTNSQYARFLNLALEEKIISFSKEKKGLILDSKNNPLFHTTESESESRISYSQKAGFEVLPGFNNHPVILVTWYGAKAFSDYFILRLPTESEWERAASVTSESVNTPIKKWIFGFSKDFIDKRFANYKYNVSSPFSKKVRTTPVGFYNGINTLELTHEDKTSQITENAISPIGAYDMSGNVFEWVSDWYSNSFKDAPLEKNFQGPPSGTLKIAKGGCYDSLSDGVRSFERMALDPSHADIYTGFRVARGTLTKP